MKKPSIKSKGTRTTGQGLPELFHFSFPKIVNEKAARSVAGVVAVMSGITLLTGSYWILGVLAIGFWLRVGYGPKFSPLALLATKIVAPRLGAKRDAPGPPKRFAQAIGAVVTTGGALLVFVFSIEGAGVVTAWIMLAFSSLESILGLCVGCKLFGLLMRMGLIPKEVCLACQDIRHL